MKPEMPEILILQFQRLRSRIRGVSAAGGFGLTMCLVATLIGLALISDIFIDLPVAIRAGMLLATGALALLGLTFWVIRPATKNVDDTELAAFVESQFPELNERLLSSVELNEEDAVSASPLMRKWLLQETVSLAKRVDFSEAVDATRAVRRCWWGGVACLALLLPLIFAGDAYAVLFSRFINPWGNYERVQNLVLTIENGDRVVAEKSDVTLEAKASWRFKEGQRPDSAWIEWTTDDGRTEARRLDWNKESESYVGTLNRVEQSFSYHVSADRSRTQSYRIDVVPLPQIEELQIEISPPAYTGQPAQFHDLALGEIRVIEQSRWEVSVTFNKSVENAEILWIDGDSHLLAGEEIAELTDGTPIMDRTEIPLNVDATSASLSEILSLESPSGRFAIRVTDKHGLSSEANVIRRLTIVPDAAPLIQFADHEENAAVRPDDIIDLPLTITDDFGIASVELHYEVTREDAKQSEGVLKAEEFEVGSRNARQVFRFDLSPLKMQAGMTLLLRGRATDERPVPEPNESWTVTRFLMIRDDAKPYGEQSVAQQQQQTKKVLEALKSELLQQKEKAKQLEQQAKDQNAKKEKWDADAEVQELREKLEKLQQQMQKLSALFEQQPLFEKIGEETRNIAEGKLQEATDKIEQAQQANLQEKPQEFAEAASKLNDAAQQLDEMQQKFDQLADLQRDLLELGRLANQTEQLANSVENLENQKQQMQSQPEPADQVQERKWDADQREAWQDYEQLDESLKSLFERRPELADAAAKNLQEKLEDLAKRAEELSKQQQNLANAAKKQAQETAKELAELQKKQNELTTAADQLAKKLESSKDKQQAVASKEKLQKALEEMKAGNAEAAEEAQKQARDELKDLAERLGKEVAAAAKEGKPDSKQSELAQESKELADKLSKATEQLQQISKGNQPAEMQPNQQSAAKNSAQQPQESNDLTEMLDQQQALAEFANDLQEKLEELSLDDAAVDQASEQFAQQSQQASEKSQQLDAVEAAKQAQQASETAQELAEKLQRDDVPQGIQQAAQQAAQQQAKLAEQMQSLAENSDAQEQLRSQLQQQTEEQTQQLSEELGERASELAAQPVNKQNESQQAEQAEQLAGEAKQAMSQASEESQKNNQGKASQKAEAAAKSLAEAAKKAKEASGEQGSDSPVSGEIGEQVAQASRQLNAAGEMLQKLGAPKPGSEGDQQGEGQPGEGESSSKESKDGGDGKGQQQGNNPQQSGQKPSTADALRQAAQSMRQASGQGGKSESKQQGEPSKQAPQQSGTSPGGESSDFGTTQQLAELMQLQVDLSNMSKRDWGQLPGELQTELLESSQKKPTGEYQRLIRRYFNDISKVRSPE